ncbi:unnamed protein product, partial [Symbiodinium microadriaticum]
MESTLWMLGVYKSVVSALDFITGATPAGAPDGYTTLQTRSQAHSASNPLLELPAATTWDQGMRASRKEMLAPPLRPSATAVIAVALVLLQPTLAALTQRYEAEGSFRTSTTTDSDFYTAWCRMYSYELFTPKTSEVHWSNPYGPDPPAEVAPPAAEPVIEDAFQKATKLCAISSSCREEGFRPDSTFAEDMSDPCSSTPPVEEPAFAALANLRVYAEMPGAPESFTLSEFYSRQGPFSPCSPASTVSYGGREARFSQALTEYNYDRQGLSSPVPTEYVVDREAWSPASTQIRAPLPEH